MSRVLAMGFFDGVHIGHAALLNRTIEIAKQKDATPSVLSFDIHPDTLVFNENVALLGDTESRREIINRCFGIEDVIFLHFSEYVKNMPWNEFLDSITSELDVCHIVCGYDFTFGYRGEGKADKMKQYCEEHGIGLDVINKVELDGVTVSSTYIRKLISDGDMETAARFLGHCHCLSDTVHSGYHIGQKMEAPTINMNIAPSVIVPKYGVYATKVILSNGEEYKAVTNVGVRPTFTDEDKVTVETHILNFSGNLYGKPARVDFYKFIRPETKFDNMESLQRQIKDDADKTKKYFEEAEKA